MTDHAVVIVGGGPTGMTLGAELKLAGIDVAMVERHPSQDLNGTRAGGLHARTIEAFDQLRVQSMRGTGLLTLASPGAS